MDVPPVMQYVFHAISSAARRQNPAAILLSIDTEPCMQAPKCWTKFADGCSRVEADNTLFADKARKEVDVPTPYHIQGPHAVSDASMQTFCARPK